MRSRISLTDSGQDVLVKMAEGNPGALSAMIDILQKHDAIDPQAAMGGIGAILMLDTWGIYGSSIYVLWNDKCDRDTRKMLLLMRATQLGLFPQSRLQQMAADQARKINLASDEWAELDTKVCEQLTEFQKVA
jgi:hypothetical protein